MPRDFGLLMMRRVFFVLTVVAWTVLVAQLIRAPVFDSVSGEGVPPVAQDGAAVVGGAMVAGVYREGVRVGESTTAIRSVADGFVLEQTTTLALRVLGEESRVLSSLKAELAHDRSVRSILVALESDGTRLDATGEVRGDEFVYAVDMGGGARRGSFVLRQPLYVSGGARSFVAERLQPGARFEFAVLDPVGWSEDVLTIQVVGEEDCGGVRAWRLEESQRGMRTSVCVDAAGRVLSESGPMGLEMRAEPAGGGVRANGQIEPLDIDAATAIPVGGIDDPRTRDGLRLRFAGVAASAFPRGAGQEVVGDDELMLRRVDPRSVGTFVLPHPGDGLPGENLGAAELLPVDHPRIRSLAAEILGAERDAVEAARRLMQWVYEYLDKVPSLGIPDALAALDAGRGDCNEHASLFTALARSAGLPARLVAGLVFVDGKFVYHAWSEVYGGEDWLPVDPALGQLPADATHIALVYGDLADQMKLAQVVGRLELSVIE